MPNSTALPAIRGLIARGDYSKAEQLARLAVEQEPSFYLYHEVLGDIYRHLGNSRRAGTSYTNALSLRPTASWLNRKLSNLTRLSQPAVCGIHERYPDNTGKRQLEGGQRLLGRNARSASGLPLISIVTVVYNNSKSLDQCLRSVCSQTYQNIEHIIIDGGSTDGTLAIIERYSGSLAYYVSEPDSGIYNAMNKGLSLARGDYILILNSDEYLQPEAIASALDESSKSPDIIVLPQRKLRADLTSLGLFGLRFFDERVYLRMPFPHLSLIASRLYNKIGFYDESYKLIADWAFVATAYQQGAKISVAETDTYLATYHRTGASAAGNDFSHPIYAEQIRLLHSHFPDIQDREVLFMLSSRMEETNSVSLTKLLASYVDSGGVLPPTLAKGIRLYAEARFGNEESKRIAGITTTGERQHSQLQEARSLIEEGKRQGLTQSGTWLINERGWDAVDSGYHFYQYLLSKKLETLKYYYVISCDSDDASKIRLLPGAHIVAPNSKEHKLRYLFSEFIISTQGGPHCHPLHHKMLRKYLPEHAPKFCFLQHGILKDEIPYFHKGRFNHDLFIISGRMEKALMQDTYSYPQADLVCSGLPRYDTLFSSSKDNKKTIAFLPTWRSAITNRADLLQSEYFHNLIALLNNEALASLLRSTGFQLHLYLHPNFSSFRSDFQKALKQEPSPIILGDSGYDYRTIIQDALVGITDYSSVIFDFAYLGKPVMYYQPDYDIFRKQHYGETPHFSYENHGLGPVCRDVGAFIDTLCSILQTAPLRLAEPYAARKDYIYSYCHRNASQRVLDHLRQYSTNNELYWRKLMSARTLTSVTDEMHCCIQAGELRLLLKIPANGVTKHFRPARISFLQSDNLLKTASVDIMASGRSRAGQDSREYSVALDLPHSATRLVINDSTYNIQDLAETPSVFQFSALIRGGAANAAIRLNDGLNRYTTYKSTIITHDYVEPGIQSVHYIDRRATHTTNNKIRSFYTTLKTHPNNILFSPHCLTTPLSNDELMELAGAADLINLHWTPGLLSLENITALLNTGKPVVWTIHDTYPFSGGCHYFHGCTRWKTNCNDCPQLRDSMGNSPSLYLTAKKEALSRYPNLTLVALNDHFRAIAEESPIFSGCRVEVIPNSIDTDIYRPLDRTACRHKHSLSPSAKYLFYTASYASRTKGFREFVETINILAKQIPERQLRILIAGSVPSGFTLPYEVTNFGKVDEQTMVELYSSTNVTVMSSIEDNLPNIVLESLSCGTPVAGFKVGGVPDLVKDNFSGFLAPVGDCAALAEAIDKALRAAHVLASNCRKFAEENLHQRVQATRYQQLYQNLLEQSGVIPFTDPSDVARVLAPRRIHALRRTVEYHRSR
jgi:glycosyltransferase involved in cell wall biosynthesis